MPKLFKKIGLVATTATLSYLAYRKISESFFDKVFLSNKTNHEIDDSLAEWLNKSKYNTIELRSFDGLVLNGLIIENNNTDDYILLSHGWNSCKNDLLDIAYEFDKLGYNLLLIDHRASGLSEGKYHTFGQKESLDILLWCNLLVSKHPNCNIHLYGISMGAASVMMALDLGLPKNVKSCVEDCGYSSLKDELDNVVKRDYKLSSSTIVLKLLENRMKDVLKISFDDVEPKKCLDNNEIPLLIVHGKDDLFVPFEMSKVIYNHNKGYKKYFAVDGAKHAECYKNINYYRVIDQFIKNI